MDLNADDADPQRAQKASQLKWDKKRKRFVKDTPGEDNKKMIRGESGALLPATFKSGRYAEWKKSAHRHSGQRSGPQSHKSTGLASAETILKGRREKEKVSREGTGTRLTVAAAAEECSRTEETSLVGTCIYCVQHESECAAGASDRAAEDDRTATAGVAGGVDQEDMISKAVVGEMHAGPPTVASCGPWVCLEAGVTWVS